jgi:hypothetical protein
MSAPPDLEFNLDSWLDMSPAERARRCLLFAHEADQLALTAAPNVRSAYADLSKQWLALAAEIEKNNPATRRSS